jgi:DNA-binding NarL/FixJ family response regulator
MRVLVVEDDENKRRQILTFLSEQADVIQIATAASYTSGLAAIRKSLPDLTLLDMSLPNFDGEFSSSDGGKFRSYGGRDILHQIKRRALAVKVLIVTQYDTFSSEDNAKSLSALSDELALEFPDNFLGTVFYNASQDDWRHHIARFIAEAKS